MHVELDNISKHFGDIRANQEVSLSLAEGEVVALLGENGAGKSTLMKVLFGIYPPDAGAIRIDGLPVQIESPRTAMNLGIGMVFQQFNLIPALSVLDNLLLAYPKAPWWLGLGRGSRSARTQAVLKHLQELAPDIDPATPVRNLAVGERQLLELIKVLNLQAKLVILDEPTSVLAPQEAERLWRMIRTLASQGRSLVLITHKMEDVMACADRVVVMRGGRLVKAMAKDKCSEQILVQLMMGEDNQRQPIEIPPPPKQAHQVWIKNLSAEQQGRRIENIDLQLKPGEILGVAGISGNGQQLLADAIAGLVPLRSGEVILKGEALQSADRKPKPTPRVAYIPEQPAVNGVASDLSLVVNVALGHFCQLDYFPRWREEAALTADIISHYNVRPPKPELAAGRLSGGNLQKLVVGRELHGNADLVIACYPTMGLDSGAAHDIYQALFERAKAGASILWISEDIDDLLQYAHRIAVLAGGRISQIVTAADADRYAIGHAMTGTHEVMLQPTLDLIAVEETEVDQTADDLSTTATSAEHHASSRPTAASTRERTA